MYCGNCGNGITYDGNFCGSCGTAIRQKPVSGEAAVNAVAQPVGSQVEQVKGPLLQATERINAMVGEQGSIDVNLKDVFSDVFKHHTKEEGEVLFIAGTSMTTPEEHAISSSWPKPWLFSRVFLTFAVAYILLALCYYEFDNLNAVPGLILVGSFAVPLSLLIFFYEMNAPRNISTYEIGTMFFIGSTASLVLTLILYSIFPIYNLDYSGAITIGIIEEVGKLLVIIYFVRKLNSSFILNGLLIGATIGAGFAAFESAGYAFTGLTFGDDQIMASTIFLRAWTGIGTHVVWSAIAGAALVYIKGGSPFTMDHVLNGKFLQLFAVPVILHSVWDMPINDGEYFYGLVIGLIFLAWLFVFAFINAGLKQISRLHRLNQNLS